MWDRVELALLERSEAERAEEEAFERRLAWLVEYVDWIKGLCDEDLLWWFRESGGDPKLGAEEAWDWAAWAARRRSNSRCPAAIACCSWSALRPAL